MIRQVAPYFLVLAAPLLASAQVSLSATPTIPLSVTAGGAVSSVLATATLSPDLGNPADLSTYPLCAQICNNETISVNQRIAPESSASDTNVLEAVCSPRFRSATAGCEAATCDSSEYDRTQLLAQQLCGSLYGSNATLSSEVSSAIAEATASAIAATSGKDPTNLSSLPQCASDCIVENNYGGCGSLSNRLCVCQGLGFNDAVGPCQVANCSPEDILTTAFVAEVLCEPVGGILTNPINYTATSNTTGTGNGTVSSPSPSPFTGQGSQLHLGVLTMVVGIVSAAVGILML